MVIDGLVVIGVTLSVFFIPLCLIAYIGENTKIGIKITDKLIDLLVN